jgi:hypothetical protein
MISQKEIKKSQNTLTNHATSSLSKSASQIADGLKHRRTWISTNMYCKKELSEPEDPAIQVPKYNTPRSNDADHIVTN